MKDDRHCCSFIGFMTPTPKFINYYETFHQVYGKDFTYDFIQGDEAKTGILWLKYCAKKA